MVYRRDTACKGTLTVCDGDLHLAVWSICMQTAGVVMAHELLKHSSRCYATRPTKLPNDLKLPSLVARDHSRAAAVLDHLHSQQRTTNAQARWSPHREAWG